MMKKYLLSAILFFQITGIAQAEIKTKELDYQAGNTSLKGYMAYDDSVKGKRPGILVVHEWWGHNEHARDRARMLAGLGYTALAIDMYGEGKTADHPKKAGALMGAAFKNWPASQERFRAGKKLLQSQKSVDPDHIGAIGFCFGGAVSLRMARGGEELSGVVAFHSALPLEPAVAKGNIKASLLVINGSEDGFLKPETVADFNKQMFEGNVDFTYMNLSGIKHSYTNKRADEFSMKFGIDNLAYDKKADEQSWQAMKIFFEKVFAQ